MIGSWRWNAAFGAFGAALTFLLSLANNPVGTTFLRSLVAFAAFALLAYALRFVLGVLLRPSAPPAEQETKEERGSVLDLVTPDEEDELSQMMKQQWTDGKEEAGGAGFEPLRPRRLASLDDADPEQVLQAIRRLTDE